MQAEEWIGRTINSYVIERVIKSGGMGIILAAKHRFLDEKPVAIKIIHPDRQHDADMANRLCGRPTRRSPSGIPASWRSSILAKRPTAMSS